ncbi:indole-3-glycerol phosphate synthase TrpC [Psychrobacillus glaciei]|uniref:Indole-3-glycerol phosphate synthase n=1 Tax=Psychrobacillus glaciei TaxID=2283160 RepID=A0A5J6SM11_9BACI|nr:indole-3-glycerol phosphate synthase TrpC [Psychrobacillus glaciei]QFF99040.1 indole-3-glycerol phosphate synthase TrpC [Psychrobacillus glaciei]
MTTILDKILLEKKKQIEIMLENDVPLQEHKITRPSLFDQLYGTEHLQIISEIKRASPSKGLIAAGVNPVVLANAYYEAGAVCISVLTDTPFFQGSFQDLAVVSDTVPIALLCKDFILHKVQIDQAINAGASVILLIVAALSEKELQNLYEYATSEGLEVLVEIHDSIELETALKMGAKLIGVNNRDLRSFEVDLSRTTEIASIFPFHEKRVLISESGIRNVEDAAQVARYGASAVLVGESLMKIGDVRATINDLKVKRGVITP